MRTKWKILISVLALALFVVIPYAAKAAAGGIQISPLTFKYEISPGQSQSGTITIKNLNSDNLDYIIESENFALVSDDGAPSFSGGNAATTSSSLAGWITVPADQTGTILALGEKNITFNIAAPANAEPGGHYAAIFARQVKKTATGQTEIGIASRVGTLILVTIPGNAKKGAEITEFTSPKVVWKGPVDFTMKVKNSGNIHFDSTGTVAIKSMFGGTTTVELGTHTILPDNSRNFSGVWSSKYPFGRYQITATATDTDGNPMTTTAVLWAVPLVIVIPVIIILIVIILVVKYLKRHLKFVPAKPDKSEKK